MMRTMLQRQNKIVGRDGHSLEVDIMGLKVKRTPYEMVKCRLEPRLMGRSSWQRTSGRAEHCRVYGPAVCASASTLSVHDD